MSSRNSPSDSPQPPEAGKGELSRNPDTPEIPAVIVALGRVSLPDDAYLSWDPQQSRVAESFSPIPGGAQGSDATHMGDGSKSFEGIATGIREQKLVLVRKLGHGSFGEVWEARQEQLGRSVAVKIVRLDLARSKDPGDTRHNFVDHNIRQEAMTAASLDHPNIVPVYDLQDDARGFPALAMKLVRGRSWDEVIKADFETSTPEDFLARHIPILQSVSQAAAFAHSRGVVHRDLKPSQVMVGDFGEVLLMDWGLGVVFDPVALEAAVQSAPSEIMATLQSASCPAGTLAYMAPEQTEATAARIGPWTDVYLLGGILYHLLSGNLPHGSGNTAELYPRAQVGYIMPLEESAPDRDMPPELVALCLQALSILPEDRPQHGRAFLEGLSAYLHGAGRRNQSRLLTDQAQNLLVTARGDYAILTNCDEMLQRARDLWGGNQHSVRLIQKVRGEFAESALIRGDLQLAKVYGERLTNEALRTDLLGRIAQAETVKSRRERERRIATVATFVAFAVIIAGTLYFNWRLTHTARDIKASQLRGENLIASLQDSLYPELEAVGQIRLLSALGTKVDDYFLAMGDGAQSSQTRISHVKALLTLRRIQSRLGETTSAIALAERTEDMALKLQVLHPGDAEIRAALASARCGLAEQLYLSGNDLPRAMEAARHAATDMSLINTNQFTNRAQMALTAKAGEDLATLLFVFEGDARSSKSLLESSWILRSRALQLDPLNLESLEGMAWHHLRMGQYQVGCGMLEESLVTFGKSRAIREQITNLAPDDFFNRREMGRLLFWMGRAHERIGQVPEAESFHKAALDIRQEMAKRDPDDITLRWNLAVSRSKVAELELNTGNSAVAERELSATLVILSQVPLGTIGNREFAGARASTLLVHGRILSQRQDQAGAIAEWQEAITILQELERTAPYEYFNLRALAEGLLYLDQLQEAEAVVAKLRKIGYSGERLSKMLVERGLKPL